MTTKARNKAGHWNFENVKREALKFKTRTQFAHGSSAAYTAAKRAGWLENVCRHMEILWQKKWNFQAVLAEASKYKTRNEFRQSCTSAYCAARNKGWLDDVCTNMVDGRVIWTKKAVAEEAKRYSARTDFAAGSGSAYHAASKNGWREDVCAHMQPLYNGYYHCVYALINERLGCAYVGVTSQRIDKRFSQHRKLQNLCRSKEIANLSDTEFRQITNYIYSAEEVQQSLEQRFCDDLAEQGFRILNNESSLGGVGYSERKWTKEGCLEEALKYSSRWDFQCYSVNAYSAAQRHGWIDDVCTHMLSTKKAPDYWSFEECKKETLKYKTRTQFRDGSPYVYKVASLNHWLEDIFADLEVVKHQMWEKSTSDRSTWRNAHQYYCIWRENQQLSAYQLSRRVGLSGHKLNSMVRRFRDGWIPMRDEKWSKWTQGFVED